MAVEIANFETDLDGFNADFTLDTGGGANSTSASAYCTNGAGGDIQPSKTVTGGTAIAGDSIEIWIKLPASNVILSGDASAVVMDQGGSWKWFSMYAYIDRASTDWQKFTVPITHFTANGNSSPGSPGTGTAYDPTATATFKFRFWNSTSYSWYLDEMFFVGSGGGAAVASTRMLMGLGI